ncbi:MAG: hotdog fold thioesterase [Bacillota bacterium]
MPKEKTASPKDGQGERFIRSLLEKDSFPNALGIIFGRVEPGYAEATLTIREEMLNFTGVTHGGVIFALADTVFGAASNAYGETALAIHADISYLRATTAGDVLTARAVEESRSGRLSHVRVTVADAGGRQVALFQGVAYIKRGSKATQR